MIVNLRPYQRKTQRVNKLKKMTKKRLQEEVLKHFATKDQLLTFLYSEEQLESVMNVSEEEYVNDIIEANGGW